MTTAKVFLGERYEPHICASPSCANPPIRAAAVATDGTLFGVERVAGQRLDVCSDHEPEVLEAAV